MEPPRLGVGIGYRAPIRAAIVQHAREFDFLEVITDGFRRNEPGLRALASLVPCVPHALNLSVGSEVDPAYLALVGRTVEATRAPWHSDHLATTRAGGIALGHLAPVPPTREALEVVVANVRRVQEAVPAPFALENIAAPFRWPHAEMPEHAFLAEVARRTGCGLLLDLENLRVDGVNHGLDPRAVLDRLPLERVQQVHVAGGEHGQGVEHDTHGAPVPRATWDLLEHLCAVAPPPAVLLERDAGFGAFPELVGEVRRARAVWAGAVA